MLKPLNKQSTEAEIKAYFCAVLNLSKSDEEFPVNLDEVWPLVYSAKEKAVRALKSNELFMQGIDYQVLAQNGEKSAVLPINGEKSNMGRPQNTYMLSVPCLEFFIARKVRPVFEVYRQVFHKVAESTEVIEKEKEIDLTQAIGLTATMQPLSDYLHQIDERWERLIGGTAGHKGHGDIESDRYNWLVSYKNLFYYTSRLVYFEALDEIEGPQFI